MTHVIGTVEGKTTPDTFSFTTTQEIERLEYLVVVNEVKGIPETILCQAVGLTHTGESVRIECTVIGIVTDHGIIPLRIPIKPGSNVQIAPEALIQTAIRLEKSETAAYLGRIEGKLLPVYVDLQTVLSKHLAILAKTGAGKSYTVGVLLEEVMENAIPLLIIDPHGEYTSMRYPNDEDRELLKTHKLKPKSYAKQITEYTALKTPSTKHLTLKDSFTPQEVLKLLPAKLSNAQKALLYSAMKDLDYISLSSIIDALHATEGTMKFGIIGMIDLLVETGIFQAQGLTPEDLILPGKATIINLKGISPDIQQIIVYKVLKDLFHARKIGSIPPHFAVVEEAHNFCPERSFGEVKSSEVIRLIASEGRKFGMGLCVISQRPARIDKSVLSQVNVQIILKVTNPNDVKAVSTSVEGITAEIEKELPKLEVGTAIISGITDMPLLVRIRPRRSKHGGVTQNIVAPPQRGDRAEQLTIIKTKPPNLEKKTIKSISAYAIPATLMLIEQNNEQALLLFERVQGNLITSLQDGKSAKVLTKRDLNENERAVMELIRDKESFDINELLKHQSLFVVGEALSSLIRKGLLYYDGIYRRKDAAVYERIVDYGNYYETVVETVQYDKKFDANMTSSDIVKTIREIATVHEAHDVYFIHYEAEYS